MLMNNGNNNYTAIQRINQNFGVFLNRQQMKLILQLIGCMNGAALETLV